MAPWIPHFPLDPFCFISFYWNYYVDFEQILGQVGPSWASTKLYCDMKKLFTLEYKLIYGGYIIIIFYKNLNQD
jgi:hypothetical protein